ncbi:MAG TPA: hypothetical protein VGK88_11780 [bacterium]
MRIISGAPSWVPERADPTREGAAWVYFGGDVRTLSALRRVMPPSAVELNAGALLDEILRDHADDLINLDRELDAEWLTLRWQTSELGYHDTLGDGLRKLCAYVAFDRLLDRRGESLWVFADDWWLADAMRSRAAARGVSVLLDEPAGLLPRWAARGARRVRDVARSVPPRIAFLRRWFHTRRACRRVPHAAAIGGSITDLDVVVCCWAKGTEILRHWGDLPDWLRAQGVRVGFLVQDVDGAGPGPELVARVRRGVIPSLFPSECLSGVDVLRLIASSWSASMHPVRRSRVANVDVTDVLRMLLREESVDGSSLWARQHAWVASFLRVRRVRVAQVLHLHEGQPWERALRMGFRRHLPAVRLIGYEHNPSFTSYLRVFPSRRECGAGSYPDLLVTCGARTRPLFITAGLRPDRVAAGPALRYTYLEAAAREPAAARGQPVVLVAPGMTRGETVEMIATALLALGGHRTIELVVRLHPLAGDADRLLAEALACCGLTGLPENVRVSRRSLADDLQRAAVVVYRASTVGLEAAVLGIPVIHLASSLTFGVDRLDGHPLPRETARTPHELRRVVEDVMTRGDIPSGGESLEQIRTSLFGPVTTESMGVFAPGRNAVVTGT